MRVEPLHWSSTLSRDDHDLIKLNFTLPEDAFITFNFSGHLVLEKMIFKDFSLSFPLYFFTLLWFHPYTRDHDLNKINSTISKDAFTKVTAFLAAWFLRRFQKFFLSIYSYVKCWHPHCDSHLPKKIMIWRNLNLNYPRMLPHMS